MDREENVGGRGWRQNNGGSEGMSDGEKEKKRENEVLEEGKTTKDKGRVKVREPGSRDRRKKR